MSRKPVEPLKLASAFYEVPRDVLEGLGDGDADTGALRLRKMMGGSVRVFAPDGTEMAPDDKPEVTAAMIEAGATVLARFARCDGWDGWCAGAAAVFRAMIEARERA
jgi:hypothetical protein